MEMPIIATIEQLEAIYGQPNESSTVKVADRITPPYRVLIEKSPFAALATCGPEGLDCSPRGDLPGFVRIHDESTLMMPDRPRQQPRRFAAQHCARSQGRVAVSDPGVRQHAARQWAGAGVRRCRLAGFVRGRRQGATNGHRHGRGRDLFSVRARHRSLRSVESGQADRSRKLADTGTDSRRHERKSCRWCGL